MTDAQLASQYSTSDRTIRTWRRAGAPLTDPKAMRRWLGTRRSLPPATAALLAGEVAALGVAARPRKPTAPSAPLVRGLLAALRRLEGEEAEGFARLQSTLGTPQEPAARKGWLLTAEALRKTDIALEAARRDAGELIPRAEAERVFNLMGWAVATGAHTSSFGIANRIDAGRPELRPALEEAMRSLVASSAAMGAGGISLPGWAREALRKGAAGGLAMPDGEFEWRTQIARELLGSATEAAFSSAMNCLSELRRQRESESAGGPSK